MIKLSAIGFSLAVGGSGQMFGRGILTPRSWIEKGGTTQLRSSVHKCVVIIVKTAWIQARRVQSILWSVRPGVVWNGL